MIPSTSRIRARSLAQLAPLSLYGPLSHCIPLLVTYGLHVTFALLGVERGICGMRPRPVSAAMAATRHTLSRRLRRAEHHFALTVYFEDTDTAGVVYYANYLKFMERARSDMIRAVGVDQGAALRSDGSAYSVTEVDIKYRRPARLGDDLVVVSPSRRSAPPRSTFISRSCAERNN